MARIETVQGLEVRFAGHRARIRSGLAIGLTVVRHGLGYRVLEAVGLIDPIEVGDAEFDQQFSVRARDADLARLALNPEVRASLLTLTGLMDLDCVEDEFRFTLPESEVDAGAALQLVVRTILLMRDSICEP